MFKKKRKAFKTKKVNIFSNIKIKSVCWLCWRVSSKIPWKIWFLEFRQKVGEKKVRISVPFIARSWLRAFFAYHSLIVFVWKKTTIFRSFFFSFYSSIPLLSLYSHQWTVVSIIFFFDKLNETKRKVIMVSSLVRNANTTGIYVTYKANNINID